MPRQPKGIPRPIRLFKADDEEIKRIADVLGLQEQELIRRLVKAGIKALRKRPQSLVANFDFEAHPAPPQRIST